MPLRPVLAGVEKNVRQRVAYLTRRSQHPSVVAAIEFVIEASVAGYVYAEA